MLHIGIPPLPLHIANRTAESTGRFALSVFAYAVLSWVIPSSPAAVRGVSELPHLNMTLDVQDY